MYRFIVIAVVLTVVLPVMLAKLDASIKKCLESVEYVHCCISMQKQAHKVKQTNVKVIYNGTVTGDIKECFPNTPLLQPCDILNCHGKKYGFISEDGTVIKEVYEKIFEEELPGPRDFIEVVKDTCFKGNVADLDGPPEMCEILKIDNCISRQAIIYHCVDDNNNHCIDLLKKCLKSDS